VKKEAEMKVASICKRTVLSLVVFVAVTQWVQAQTGRESGRFAGNFAEVEIVLNDDVTLSDISSLPRAPGGELEVLDGGNRVKVQLPIEAVTALADAGAEITVSRKFALVEADTSRADPPETDVSPLAACPGIPYHDDSEYNVYIQNNLYWFGSGIDFSLVPGGRTVLCIDVHYRVRDLSWISLVDVALSEEDYQTYMYTLESGWWGSDGDIVKTKYGINAFNGEALSQAWYLWAADLYADGWGYIDYWWIKLYYENGGTGYCTASGDNYSYEHISRVQVGDIDNATAGSNYTDYTNLSTIMQIGTHYQITVTNAYPYDQYDGCGVWVDWNQDEDFEDAAETISVSPDQTIPEGGVITFVGTITPPAGAALGSTRMRVRVLWKDTISPCGTTTYGEVEDYTINVTPAGLVGDLIPPEGVDFRDYAVLAAQWLQSPGVPSADIAPPGGDGIVSWLDLATQADNWLEGIVP
jgi:hypothetical protein